MKQYADLNLTGHTLSDFLLTSSTALTAAGKMRYSDKKYYGFTTEEVAFLLKTDESSLSVKSAAQLTTSRKLWGNPFNGTADVSGDITLGSGKRLYFGSTGYYIELVDGNLHTNVGFYSDKFISARGKDSSGSSGGGADLEAVWESLTGTVAPYASSVINVAHIPDLGISKITGLQSDLTTLENGISAINAKIPSAASSENQLADKAFVSQLVNGLPVATQSAAGLMSAADKTKLDGIDASIESSLTSAVASVSERLTSLEAWQTNPSASDLFVDVLGANSINLEGIDITSTASGIISVAGSVSIAGAADIGGDITLGSGKKIYFGDSGHYIELVDGAFHANAGFYSDAFVSARGKDDSGSSGGGAGLEEVWASLAGTVAPYASSVINVAHIPDLGISKITGLQSDLDTLTSGINTINSKIPSAASDTNQLADKNFVNSSISTATAAFAGTVTSLAALKALDGDLNDYAFYSYTDSAGNTVYARYKYDPNYSSTDTGHWKFEYNLNNSSFTAAQWSAINSGITSTLVAKLGNIATGAQANVIETVKVNGTALTPSGKAVNITVATGSSNGTLSVNGADVAVKGLAALAYKGSLAFSELSSRPSTLSGYGITDGVNAVATTGGGNAVTSLSVSNHTLTYAKDTTFFTTAGNGLSASGATVSAKVDSSGEFLSVSSNGLKVSGVSTAISTAVANAELALSVAVASLAGRVEALEAWQTNPSASDLFVDVLGANSINLEGIDITSTASGTISVAGSVSIAGAADIGGDITLGSGKKIYFGDSGHYIELADGAFHASAGFYSDAFVSARGKDSSGSSGGGADLEAVWESLTGTVAPYASSVINVAHIPDLGISKITGLQSDLTTLENGISAINAKIPSAASSENQLADKAFVSQLVNGLPVATQSAEGLMSAADKTKLDGIDASIESSLTSAVASVSERLTSLEAWAESPTASDAFIDVLNAISINLEGEDITASRFTAVEANLAGHTANKANPHGVTKAQVGLGSVENTALSTWAGTGNITTVGTISSGTWQGSKIANGYLANSSITINGSAVSLGSSFNTGSITAGAAGTSSATSGYTLAVPYVTMNKYGIVTGYGTHTHTVSGVPNSSLVNSSITIAGTSVSLGSSVSAATIKSAMSFSSLSFSAGTFSSVNAYNTNAAVSVNIPTTTSHISEGGNLYFTNARAVSACSGTYQTIANTDNAELALSVAVASLAGRVEALEAWQTNPSASDLFVDVLGANGIDLKGIDITSAASGTLSVGGLLYASTGVYTSGYVSARGQDTSSDISLKKDLKPIDNALDYVLGTRYWKFKWKDNGEDCIGIIAQEEREREYGFLVRKHSDKYTYDYAASTALLGAALQEEDNKVERLRLRIERLENKLNSI